jgi:hypothetical protein
VKINLKVVWLADIIILAFRDIPGLSDTSYDQVKGKR